MYSKMSKKYRHFIYQNSGFILQFKPNSYNQATKNLNRQEFETFLTFHCTTSRKASRFKNNVKPLFSS